jgi:uncharacterized protein YndB with AHSA1/START domain
MNPNDFQPGPLADVDCLAGDEEWTLVFVRDLRHPPERVWAALTEPEELEKWAPYAANRSLASPGDLTLTMLGADPTVDPAQLRSAATVRRAEAPTLLEHTWGSGLLRWELAATGSGTRLTLRHTVDDPDWVPKAAAGWHICLVVAEHLLAGQPIEPIRGEAAYGYGWQELHDAYAARLGLGKTP